ncbi:hypothetical protein LL033_05300 [Clostridium estertheticum]|uniref:hypothetical protein n=1 Tax=Clostridium estertheticum TaxID=238834 RepID=UPI001C0D753A|nr:hypothetical protein [Clostridium estertheticum]MBU3217482.1 hypothetical protein [Clostridium estertheticum]WAG56661.1 hypothetical protein LL033_05300 [Clostridium estertheticum]
MERRFFKLILKETIKMTDSNLIENKRKKSHKKIWIIFISLAILFIGIYIITLK